jgi:hypothetical protein
MKSLKTFSTKRMQKKESKNTKIQLTYLNGQWGPRKDLKTLKQPWMMQVRVLKYEKQMYFREDRASKMKGGEC